MSEISHTAGSGARSFSVGLLMFTRMKQGKTRFRMVLVTMDESHR
jgi:hypothetical protein